MDLSARMQHFDLKTKYAFQTVPGVDQYNMPLYDVQVEGTNPGQAINFYPVYQGFLDPCYINGVQVPLQTLKQQFFNMFPNIVQNLQGVAVGDGGNTYIFNVPIISNIQPNPLNPPLQGLLRGHVDMGGIIATGNNVDPPLVTTLDTNIPSTSIYPAVYITATNTDGSNIVVQDSGQFLSGNQNYGLLMKPGTAPFGYSALPGGYETSFAITNITQASQAVITANTTLQVGQLITIAGVIGMTEINGLTATVVSVTPTTVTIDIDTTTFTPYVSGGTISSLNNVINYFTGEIRVSFPVSIPVGVNINVQCYYFQTGLPRAIFYNNNTICLRSPPDKQYLVELDAYLTPAAFLTTESAIQFAYMSEYIARGAARKILSDTGDVEQFMFYEPLFKEQELLVWKRSQRQWTNNRTPTIYSQGQGMGMGWAGNNFSGNAF